MVFLSRASPIAQVTPSMSQSRPGPNRDPAHAISQGACRVRAPDHAPVSEKIAARAENKSLREAPLHPLIKREMRASTVAATSMMSFTDQRWKVLLILKPTLRK